jgi:HSP20 family molecular chaperone IbpA
VRRRITLPRDADLEHVTTKFKDGVLRVVVAKLGQAHPSAIKLTITAE